MRNVIVTGGTRGIGLAIARSLAATGYRVVALAREAGDPFAEARREVEEQGGALHFQPADLADIAAIPELARRLRKEFGTFHGLVNNAGCGTSGLLAMLPDGKIDALIRLNVQSPIVLTKYLVRSMIANNGGRIVNLASVVAATGYNGLAAYGATKAAMVGFTRSLAREVGPLGITVNAVAPGFIDTEMTRTLVGGQRERIVRRSALRRLAESADVANTVAFLLSDQARNITGTVLTVDAGGTA